MCKIRFFFFFILVFIFKSYAQTFERVEKLVGFNKVSENNGVAVADYDGDLDLDIFIVAKSRDSDFKPITKSRLFRNNSNGTFTDVTEASNLVNLLLKEETSVDDSDSDGFKNGVSWGDYDNDGFPDIFFTYSTKVQLFHNNGDSTFSDVTSSVGIKSKNDCSNTGATWFDVNNDGFLDIYVSEWGRCGTNNFYVNNGDGTFTDATQKFFGNIASKASFTAMPFDFNLDGWMDLYVTQDLIDSNDLFINEGGNSFLENTLAYALDNTQDDMGIAIGDYNNDGNFDFYIATINNNSLFTNNGDNIFNNLAQQYNLENTGWSWGPIFADFDLDGDEDLFITNGYKENIPVQERNFYFENLYVNGQNTFRNQSSTLGFIDEATSVTPLAFDYDNDGDLDLFVTNSDKEAHFYENTIIHHNADNTSNWFQVALRGTTSNRDAIGAIVSITTNIGSQCRYKNGITFFSQSLKPLHFGLASATSISEITIKWPSGIEEIYNDFTSNKSFLFIEGDNYQEYNIPNVKKITGCTDPKSCNYNPLATISDDSCEYLTSNEIIGTDTPSFLSVETYFYSSMHENSAYEWKVKGGEIISGYNSNTIIVKWGVTDRGVVTLEESNSTCSSKKIELEVHLNASNLSDNHSISRLWNEVLLNAIRGDYAYINQGNNNFEDELTKRFNHIPFYAMGIDVVDFNNDGFEDIMQLEMLPEDYERSKTTMASMNTKLFSDMTSNGFYYQYMHNILHLNRGNGIFSDISAYAGIEKTDWSWACLGSDFDNDGYRDLFISNGFRRDIWDKDTNNNIANYMQSNKARKNTDQQNATYIVNQFKENKIANYIYKNNRNLTFSKKVKEWGLEKESFSNGAAVADLDNDGDLDLIINNIEDHAFIYENKAEKLANNYLKLKLVGPHHNQSGLGAKITIKHNNKKQFHEFKTVRGYLSSVEPLVHFGLEKDTIVSDVEVVWLDGKISKINNVASNQLVAVNYNEAIESNVNNKEFKTLFSNKITSTFSKPFTHKENVYNDFEKQVLLPHKLSQNGPCIAVGDINGDKLEDFFVGGAANQKSVIYIQTISGKFITKENVVIDNDAKHEDVGAVFFDADNDNDLDLYVVSGGNEFKIKSNIFRDRLYINDGKGNFYKSNKLPEMLQSGSCVVPLDYDDDNDMDLFIGGRLTPNKYPLAPNSFLLENTNGIFKDVTQQIAPELFKIGMVTSAVFEDIDGDRIKELLVVGEWMPITVFKKEKGVYKNVTADLNLLQTTGWWNKIEAADLDNDGDVDFVVGNLGLNYKFKASKDKPFMIFASDYDSNGTNDIFLAKYNNNKKVPIRGKECTSEQLPSIREKFKTYTEFAKADIIEILGEDSKNAIAYEAKQFASIILENNKGKLIVKKLPLESQLSVVNSIIVEDFNKDGILDIVIAGNKFEVEIETTRADASLGLVLLGSKTGKYKTLSYLESGLYLPYNIKEIKKININNKKAGILSGINDNELQFFIENK